MYAQVEKSKENKSRTVANSVDPKKSSVKHSFQFVDNRPETLAQRKINNMSLSNNRSLKMDSAGATTQLKIKNTKRQSLNVSPRWSSINRGELAANFGWSELQDRIYESNARSHVECQVMENTAKDNGTHSLYTERYPCSECGPKLEADGRDWDVVYSFSNTSEALNTLYYVHGCRTWKGKSVPDDLQISDLNGNSLDKLIGRSLALHEGLVKAKQSGK